MLHGSIHVWILNLSGLLSVLCKVLLAPPHVSRLTIQGYSPLKTAKRWTLEDPHVELFLPHPVHSAGPGYVQPPAPTYSDKDERSKTEQKGYHKWWGSFWPTHAPFSGGKHIVHSEAFECICKISRHGFLLH